MDMKKVCEEYYQTVYGYLITITGGNYDLAEELTQETFYRAIKNAGKFRGDCKMSTWLCQIAKFGFYQHLDKKNRRKEVSMDTAIEQAAEQQLEKEYISNEQKLEIYKKIQQLESPTKDVLMLRLSGELSFREIGEILGKTENWARVTFYRGKQMLGKELGKDE
ncbi:MAG: sigma-70 family RNA polymerase sigma factor [Lachnospiraceae bacterium]|nr:sigma-70 family RNA polymerase sigma factor [Lachnospiraceae bacterium]